MIDCCYATKDELDSIIICTNFIAVDAVYEEMKKRVFLLTILFALAHIPFILEIIALYPKLGPRTTDNTDIEYSKLEHE